MFILGAGASAPFGVPTLKNIFKDPHARRYLAQHPALLRELEQVFWQPRGHDLETSDQCITIEEILTIIRDYERNNDTAIPPLAIRDTAAFKRALYILIKKAIYDGKSSQARHLNPIIQFAHSAFQSITWAAFNWDCIFEASFYYQTGKNPRLVEKLDHWWNGPVKDVFLKLHGGINWWYDQDCAIYLPFGSSQGQINQRWLAYEKRKSPTGTPLLLEPSFYKYGDEFYDLLKPQWDYFLQALIHTHLVIIIGYSLPDFDAEARKAITMAFQTNSAMKILVIDQNPTVCEKYIRVFGRERVQTLSIPYHCNMEKVLGFIRENMELNAECGIRNAK